MAKMIVKPLNMMAFTSPRALLLISNMFQDKFMNVCVKIGTHKLYCHSTNSHADRMALEKVSMKIPINSAKSSL